MFKGKIKNKGMIIAFAIGAIVLILGVILFPKFQEGYMGKTTKVYMLKSAVPKNTVITNDMLIEIDYPEEYIKDKTIVLSDSAKIVGQYSKQTISKNDILSKEKLTDTTDIALYSEGNLLAVTVSSLSSSVAGKISSGDIVKVYAFIEDDNTGKDIVSSPEILKEMEIAYILTSQAEDTNSNEEETLVPNVVVFKINDNKQAEELLKLEYKGKIHLEKINPVQEEKW